MDDKKKKKPAAAGAVPDLWPVSNRTTRHPGPISTKRRKPEIACALSGIAPEHSRSRSSTSFATCLLLEDLGEQSGVSFRILIDRSQPPLANAPRLTPPHAAHSDCTQWVVRW